MIMSLVNQTTHEIQSCGAQKIILCTRGSAIHRWVCEGGGGVGSSRRGGVTSMDHHDMTGDGIRDLIVGRDDGSLEVYSYEDGDESEPTMRFSMVSHKDKANMI